MTDTPRPILTIVGPTAGGKTSLALALATQLPGGGECICADSMQVYRSMDIGTAKPTAAERATVRHHVLDVVEPDDESFSVAQWLKLAHDATRDVRSRNQWPIVVGGTNLYVKALLEGLFDGPPADEALRLQLQPLPLAELRARLLAVDPEAAAMIHANDRRRTIRALEVHAQTGTPISELQQEWRSAQPRRDAIVIGLEYPATDINRRINARVKQMMEDGLLEEVHQLYTAERLGVTARAALGYAQLIEHLEGKISLDDAVEAIKIRTRRYAKQQRTWLRRFRVYPGSMWFDAAAHDIESIAGQVCDALRQRSGVPGAGADTDRGE
ncbi:MAG: tRNA (adenosine(37)-N6)-dimethylallyltransferase MiaA [Phycisphaerales bacterium]